MTRAVQGQFDERFGAAAFEHETCSRFFRQRLEVTCGDLGDGGPAGSGRHLEPDDAPGRSGAAAFRTFGTFGTFGDVPLHEGHDVGVAGVRDDQPVVGKPLQQLRLGPGNCLHARGNTHLLEAGEVRRSYVREHRNVRPAEPADRGQLAGRRHPHLGHQPLAVLVHGKQREREAKKVVQIARTLVNPPAFAEQQSQQILGRRLAGRAGDRRDPGLELPAMVPGQIVERRGHVADPDLGAPGLVDRRLDHRGRGARGQGIGHEAMAVGPLAGQREEQLAAPDPARVDRRTLVADAGLNPSDQAAVHDPGRVSKGPSHRPAPR